MEANVASSAFSNAAFHFVFDSCVNLFILETEVFKGFNDKFDHDGRAAGNGYSIIRGRFFVCYILRNESDKLIPVGFFDIDGKVNGYFLLDLLQFFTENQVFGCPCSLDQCQVSVFLFLPKGCVEDRPDWSKADTSTDKDEVFSLPVFDRKAIAVGSPDPDDISG